MIKINQQNGTELVIICDPHQKPITEVAEK